MHLHDRAGTLASLLYKAEKPSVCLSVCLSACLTVMPASQQCQHRPKRDPLEMKAEPPGTSKYVLICPNVPAFIHTSVQKAAVQAKTAINCVNLDSVGSATDFNTKGPKFDPSLGMSNVLRKLFFKLTELFKLAYF